MLLGKRPRPMKRTTSVTEFIPEIGVLEISQPSDIFQEHHHHQSVGNPSEGSHEWLTSGYVAAIATPRRSSGFDMAPFLKACGLCKRHLGPGKDIYMYRGEMAFCSLECREEQMKLDERKDKCSISLKKKDASNTL